MNHVSKGASPQFFQAFRLSFLVLSMGIVLLGCSRNPDHLLGEGFDLSEGGPPKQPESTGHVDPGSESIIDSVSVTFANGLLSLEAQRLPNIFITLATIGVNDHVMMCCDPFSLSLPDSGHHDNPRFRFSANAHGAQGTGYLEQVSLTEFEMYILSLSKKLIPVEGSFDISWDGLTLDGSYGPTEESIEAILIRQGDPSETISNAFRITSLADHKLTLTLEPAVTPGKYTLTLKRAVRSRDGKMKSTYTSAEQDIEVLPPSE
jgi:hypothetical protein